MSVRMAGPAVMPLENLEARRLLSAAGAAVAWDLKTPISSNISQKGEVDYYKFQASAGEQMVFDSTGLKQFAILDSDGSTEVDHFFIYDGMLNPTPGRLVWTAPHGGTFYVSVAGYTAFLIDSPTGAYSLAANAAHQENGPLIAAGQTINGSFSSAGDVDEYSFDAKAGTIYRFELASASGTSPHQVMGVVEVQPWTPPPMQPADALEAYPGHNTRFTNLDEQKGLGNFAEWVAPASGRYHFSIAPLDGQHVGAYTLVMSQRAFPCDPQNPLPETPATPQNIQPTTSSPAARHRKPRKHHRRSAVHKHETPAAKENLHSATQKLLLPARD